MIIQFETIEEFNRVWEDFLVKCHRENWRMPHASYSEQVGLRYLKTARFQWIAETFRQWHLFATDYLSKKRIKII